MKMAAVGHIEETETGGQAQAYRLRDSEPGGHHGTLNRIQASHAKASESLGQDHQPRL